MVSGGNYAPRGGVRGGVAPDKSDAVIKRHGEKNVRLCLLTIPIHSVGADTRSVPPCGRTPQIPKELCLLCISGWCREDYYQATIEPLVWVGIGGDVGSELFQHFLKAVAELLKTSGRHAGVNTHENGSGF